MPCLGYIGELKEIRRIGEEALAVEWRIRDVLTLPGGNYDCYQSGIFRMGDESWNLKLYPKWKSVKQQPASGWLRLDLVRYNIRLDKTFHCSVGIRGSGGMVEKGREVEKNFLGYDDDDDDDVGPDYYPWVDFCSRTELLDHKTRLMPDGLLVITCAIKRPGAAIGEDLLSRSEQIVLKGEDSEATLKEQAVDELLSSFQSLLKSEEDCDVVIKVQGKEFRAHRLILRARSPVFQAMFSHDMVEKQRGVVTMEDCDQEAFPAFLEHIYTGGIGMISTDNVFSLYASSDKYDLKMLKKACAEFMKNNLTISSFCGTVALAVKYNEKELIEVATEFFCNNSLDIVKTAEWQIFLTENPMVGNELYIKQLTK